SFAHERKMISSDLSNRLVFILSLLGLGVASFLFYEYQIAGTIVCPTGQGCDIVRLSPYSSFFGISIPLLGIVFYLTVAVLAVVRTQALFSKIHKLQLLIASAGVGFGIYLTYLELFVIKAICFWCVLSFTISLAILLSVIIARKNNENRN
ncbi:MAG: vitamin K epoxide reductase family protein, partial [Candidatus Daviesbacteria bacterium]|nr:vitamin K epoxide reductase family protein [Candidatus Daviesbacteria bacterium]